MLVGPKLIKSRFLSLLITLCLAVVFFLLVNSIQNVKIGKIVDFPMEGGVKTPGAYLKYIQPNLSSEGYCKLNYGLPWMELVYTKEDLSGSPGLGQDSPFYILYNVTQGKINDDQPGVTYVTQLTNDFVLYISEVVSHTTLVTLVSLGHWGNPRFALEYDPKFVHLDFVFSQKVSHMLHETTEKGRRHKYWEGPISVAAYLPDGDPKIILESLLHFCYCIPEMSRVSLHLVFKKSLKPTFYLSRVLPPRECDIQDLVKWSYEYSLSNRDISNNNNNNTRNKAVDNWYPINVCRNAAREAASTDYILVCDVELMPSQGLASRFMDMTESYKCEEGDCSKRVYVVPVFEVESTENVPRTKSQLVGLMSQKRAVYFHQLICQHCQKFPGLEEWKDSDPGDIVKPLIETKREVPYDRWEPIYIGTKDEPLYFEKLSWEGFQDKMLQMLEMCLAGYKLSILDGAFLVHWPGMKTAKRKDEPWRTPFIKRNQEQYNLLLKNITKKYPANPQCKVK